MQEHCNSNHKVKDDKAYRCFKTMHKRDSQYEEKDEQNHGLKKHTNREKNKISGNSKKGNQNRKKTKGYEEIIPLVHNNIQYLGSAIHPSGNHIGKKWKCVMFSRHNEPHKMHANINVCVGDE